MKCLNKVLTIIGCITAAVAVVTAAFAVLNYFKEKKENAEHIQKRIIIHCHTYAKPQAQREAGFRGSLRGTRGSCGRCSR